MRRGGGDLGSLGVFLAFRWILEFLGLDKILE